MNYGAEITVNTNGMSPLMTAAERKNHEVVEYLIKHARVSLGEEIEAFELLGASYANDKRNYCLTKAHQYLSKAMELRYYI